jgi:hypothetical protein
MKTQKEAYYYRNGAYKAVWAVCLSRTGARPGYGALWRRFQNVTNTCVLASACRAHMCTFNASMHLHLPRAHHELRNRSAAHESASALAHALACYDLFLEQQSINRNNTNVLLLLSYRLLRVWACDCHSVTSLSQYMAWPALCLRCLGKAA